MSFLLKFMSKNKFENSWFGKFGNFLHRGNLNIIVKLLDGTEISYEIPVGFL